jgi:TctA family transporter
MLAGQAHHVAGRISMNDDQITKKDGFTLILVCITLIAFGSIVISACQEDTKHNSQRKECDRKGGAWFRNDYMCLDVRHIVVSGD